MTLVTLPDRRFALFRLGAAALTVLTLALYLLALPARYAELSRVCAPPQTNCENDALPSAENVLQLAASGLSLKSYAAYYVGSRLVSLAVFVSVALLITSRRRDPMALFVAVFLVMWGANDATIPALVRSAPAFTVPYLLVQWSAVTELALFFVLFPDGKAVPRFMRWIVAGWSVYILVGLVVPHFADNRPAWIDFAAWLGLFLVGAAAQVYRYRRVSSAEARYQTKWVVFGVVILGLGVVVTFLSVMVAAPDLLKSKTPAWFAFDLFGSGLILLIPVSIGIAILRYRLFDIDLIIRRTLIYATLTALLALAYLGSILALQSLVDLFAGQGNTPLVTVLSTLFIAALFGPLRRRVQAVIDRRFFRRKYDAARTVAAFGAALRDETNLEQLSAHLTAVVDEAMQPESVGLWLKAGEMPMTGR
jgi:hypothetical protein